MTSRELKRMAWSLTVCFMLALALTSGIALGVKAGRLLGAW